MVESKRSGAELLDEDYDEVSFEPDPSSTPFDQTVNIMATTGGPKLELFCRSSKALVEAIQVCHNLEYRFRSGYIKSRKDQLMRLSVSANGQGRSELVTALQAGSGVPGEFYESRGAGNMGFSE